MSIVWNDVLNCMRVPKYCGSIMSPDTKFALICSQISLREAKSWYHCICNFNKETEKN